MELKTGVKTTEFWLTVITLIAGVLDLISLPTWAMAVLPSVYTIARAIAKALPQRE